MTLIEPPASASFGFVTGRFALAVADTAQDVDHVPNFVPAAGTVTFRPAATKLITTSPTRYVSPQPVTATLNSAGALTDHNGLNGIWLVVGTYSVTFNLAGITVQRFDIAVTAAHTEADPLDLVMVTPAPIEPTVKFVVNELVMTETLAARDEVVALLEGLEGGLGAGIDDAATATVTTWSSSKINMSLAGKASTSHTHTTANVTGLDSALAGKADAAATTSALAGKASTSHSHGTADVTGLDAALAGKATSAQGAKADTAVQPAGLVTTALTDATTVGKALMVAATGTAARAAIGAGSSNLGLGTTTGTAADAGTMATALAGKAAASHSHATSDVTGLDTALAGKATTAQGAKADTAVQPPAIAYMVTSPNDTVRTIERHGSQAAIPTPYVAKRLYLVPDEA